MTRVTNATCGDRSAVTQMPLSDLKIRKSKQKDKPYRLSDGLGLHIRIQPTGSKLWKFRYQFMGKEKLLSLGQYPTVSLAEARAKRDDAKRLLADGIDPSVQKKLDGIDAHVKAEDVDVLHPVGEPDTEGFAAVATVGGTDHRDAVGIPVHPHSLTKEPACR